MDNKLMIEKLEQLHLTQNEATVYVALLQIGQTSAGEIIRQTGYHRSVVYTSLDKLISKKLVFKIEKRNISYYSVTDPSRILHNIKVEQELAASLIPSLKKMADVKLPEIVIYEGLESYRKFWLDSASNLPVGTVDYIAGSIDKRWQEYMGDSLSIFLKRRIKRKIKWQMIVFDKDDLELELLAKYPELHEYRLIQKKTVKDGNFNILGNESLVLHSATEPMIIEVKNNTLVKVFRNIFDILWENGKKIG